MTTLSDRPNTALLVIDVQNGNTAKAYEQDAVIAGTPTGTPSRPPSWSRCWPERPSGTRRRPAGRPTSPTRKA
jgi:hypothetical protein